MAVLEVKDLKKTYANGVTALKGINLQVSQGDFFALLGPNGAGKSTIIGILSSLVLKTAGKIFIFDHDIDNELEIAKSYIGVVPQELNFNPFEKITQILVNQAGYYGIPKKIAEQRAEHYLKVMDLWDKRDASVMRLSGGMKRRLMIARALMNEPKLLILDEPTAGVDIEIRHSLWTFLTELNKQGTTIILTTHYLEEAEHLCKHLAIIDHGEIIEYSNMKSLLSRLHIQTLILDLEKPVSASSLPKDFQYRLLDETTLEVELQKGQSLSHLFSELIKQHITVISMRNKVNRLEELFVRLITENKAKSV